MKQTWFSSHLFLFSLLFFVFMGGCQVMDHHTKHDPYLDMSKQKISEAFLPQPQALTRPLPLTPPLLKAHPETVFPQAAQKKISLSITEQVPLKEVFHSLAKESSLVISVDSGIKGGIVYHAHNRPVEFVIKDLCEAGRLRYKIKNGMIKIESDTPFLRTYAIQYLAITRKNESRISIATDVFTSIDQRQNQVDNGSNTLVTSESKSDFWQELEANLDNMIKSYGPEASFTLHRQGGLLSVMAPEHCQKEIAHYLSLLDTAMTAQVLIEAKIIEVQLKEEFKSGINWNSIKGDFVVQGPLGSIATPGPLDRAQVPLRDVFSIGGSGRHLTGLISFLNTFGTVRTLSNPRLMVMNNQSAILKVATNEVFFRVDYSRESGFETKRDRENVSSEIHTVPIGLVMMVHPAINTETQSIIMTLRPTISRVVKQKEDPAVSILSKQTQQSLIPEVQVREYDSVVCMQSGQPIVYAGLMIDEGAMDESGLPDISDVPFLGSFFKGKSSKQSKTELVIWIQANIVERLSAPDSVYDQDKRIYETFARDPRPLVY